MSKRKSQVLIALTWTVAAILGVLPWIWPWYRHFMDTTLAQAYMFESIGILVGVMTMRVLYERRS